MNQKLLAATLFPIEGLAEQTFRLRVLRVIDPIPRDDGTPIRLQRWASQLWRNTRQPVMPTEHFGFPGFVMPDVKTATPGQQFSIIEVPDVEYRIEVTDQTVEIAPEKANDAERHIAAEMVKRSITDAFGSLTDRYWRFHWNCFFRMVPENAGCARDRVNAFRGLRFSVVFLDGKTPLLAADITTKYFGRKSLADYSPEERERCLRWHLGEDVAPEDRAWFMRDNGTFKRPCRFAGFVGRNVGEHRPPGMTQTIWEYYRERYPQVTLAQDEAAVHVKDHAAREGCDAPASRLFPIFTTEDDEMSECSVPPQMSPQDRIEAIRSFLVDLKSLVFAGRKFTISQDFVTRPRSVFTAPNLEFGNGKTLGMYEDAGRGGSQTGDEDSAFNQYRNAKVSLLYESGTYGSQPLPDVVFLYPELLPRAVREGLLNRLSEEMHAVLGSRLNIVRQGHYKFGRNIGMGEGLLDQAEELARQSLGPVLVLVVLADGFSDDVHRLLKCTLRDYHSQCLTERTARRIVNEPNASTSASRLRNLMLAILTEAGIQPWVLAEDLQNDFYAGIDVLDGLVNYMFVYGKGGRMSRVDFGERLRRRGLREKVDRVELRSKLESGIRAAKEAGAPLRSIVVHRDGRWWPSEDQGLTEAIRNLRQEGILTADCRIGVVEIRKSSLPVRLFTQNNTGQGRLENPIPGSHLVLDQSTVLLTTTGRPGVWDRQHRTASTLVLKVVRQDEKSPFDILKLAQDAYWLTHLNWNAPDIEISLPVTIRWSDNHLRGQVMAAPSESALNDNEKPQGDED